VTNWKTTAVGILTAAVAWGNAIIAQIDGNTATVADWNLAVVATMAAVGFIFAKDAAKQ